MCMIYDKQIVEDVFETLVTSKYEHKEHINTVTEVKIHKESECTP